MYIIVYAQLSTWCAASDRHKNS